jgi:hypothetical protein
MALLAVNILPSASVLGDLFLGVIAALITIAVARHFHSDAGSLAGAVCLGMVAVPFFFLLFTYALQIHVSSGSFNVYLGNGLIAAIPSTFTGGIGICIAESLAPKGRN